jgi:Prolyl oligopeptidase family
VLFHPELYKAAVSACGCHDNRMDKASWNEQWMGYPVGPWYSESSNIDNAHRLRGKLMLLVSEMDTNVPPESTLRLADALIRAGKDFDLVVVPNADHGMGGAYGLRRMQDFFVRHLLQAEPPDRNALVNETMAYDGHVDWRFKPSRPQAVPNLRPEDCLNVPALDFTRTSRDLAVPRSQEFKGHRLELGFNNKP